VSVFRTDCSACVFNTATEGVECYIGRYEKFKAKGKAQETSIDGLCTSCRNEKWTDKFIVEESNLEKYKEGMYNELKHQHSVLVIDDFKDGLVIERLKTTLPSLIKQNPYNIVVTYEGEDSLFELQKYTSEFYTETGIRVSLRKIFEQEYQYEIIDFGFGLCEGLFFVVQINGQELKENLLSSIFEYVEVDLEKFLLLDPEVDTMHGLIAHTIYFKQIGGFANESAIEKTKRLSERDNLPWMLITYKDLMKEQNENNSTDS